MRGVSGFPRFLQVPMGKALGLVAAGGMALGMVQPLSAACPDGSPPPPSPWWVTAFLEAAAESTRPSAAVENVKELHGQARCGDEDAIVELTWQAEAPETALLATAALADVGRLRVLDLFDVLERAPLAPDAKTDLFERAVEWQSRREPRATPREIASHTAWAAESGYGPLMDLANGLLASHGDSTAIDARAERLLACAENADGDVGFDCLGIHELHTASLATIESRWDAASAAQRIWLARWAHRDKDMQGYLRTKLLSEESRVQYEILIGVLQDGGASVAAIDASLALLDQVATDPGRRPPAVPIDFGSDVTRGNLFGVAAHESAGGYPTALQAAFEELATYPDATDVMRRLAALDHPWLATHAGMWLVRHGQAADIRYAMRHTLEDDGLPPSIVLERLVRGLDANASDRIRVLFLDSLEHGALGKWHAFSTAPYEALLEDPDCIEAIESRIAALPRRLADSAIDITLDEAFQVRVTKYEAFKSELDAFEWAMKATKDHPVIPDRYLRAFAALDAPFWKAFTMASAMELGRPDIARSIAPDLIDVPLEPLRSAAREILESEE